MRTSYFTTLILVSCIVIAGCSRPGLSEFDEPGEFVEEPGLGIRFVSAAFRTNGTLRSDRINLESDSFEMLFVFLPESGLYIVTIEKTDASVQSGQFIGSELLFSAGRTEIHFQSQGGHVFSDGVDRPAWVEFISGFDISRPGASVQGAVVGLARDRSQIPGL